MSERSFTLRLTKGGNLTLSDSRQGNFRLVLSESAPERMGDADVILPPADLRRLVDAAKLFLESE